MPDLVKYFGGSPVIFELSVIMIAAFLITRLTKLLKLPNVTGYILAGILIGPYTFSIISLETVLQMDFVTDIALSLIAFGVGKYMKLENFKKSGMKTLVITLCETILSMAVMTLIMIYVFRLSIPFSIIIGAIAGATAPASTVMNIRQCKAKGEFVNTTLQVVAFDNFISIIAFSIAVAAVQMVSGNEKIDFAFFVAPILINFFGVIIGITMGFLLSLLVKIVKSNDTMLIVTISTILLISYICSAMNISPLLAAMALGATYINASGDKKVYKLINQFAPPILMVFFVVSGMSLDVSTLKSVGIIGIVYFIVRIITKYAGAFIGAVVTGSPSTIKKYLGLALIPQAGVSIGLAALGSRILPHEFSSMLSVIILSSAILYEIVGPILSKASLYLSGSVKPEKKKGKGIICVDETHEKRGEITSVEKMMTSKK